MRKASTCWMTRGKDVVRRRCRGKGSLQRRGVSSCVQWKVNGTLPTALFPISMHSSHWLADKVQRSTDCFFFPEPPGGVVPRGEGGRCQRIGTQGLRVSLALLFWQALFPGVRRQQPRQAIRAGATYPQPRSPLNAGGSAVIMASLGGAVAYPQGY